MNYKLHYNKLIDRAKFRLLEGYTEKHHIIPRCLGGSDDTNNLVSLTAEEHYVAHQLLVKIHPNNHKLVYAANMMTLNLNGNRPKNKLYAWLKIKYAKAVSEQMTGTKQSQETIKKRADAARGKNHSDEWKQNISNGLKGKTHSIERRQRNSESHKGQIAWNKGIPMSAEAKQKLSQTNLGQKHSVVTCTNCGKDGGARAMKRYHFENCNVS